MTTPAPERWRVLRIWPSQKLDHVRLEYDPRSDGTFSGMWIVLSQLPDMLRWLYQDMPDADLESIVHNFKALRESGHTERFLEVKRKLPTEYQIPQPAEITDFQW